MAAEPLVLYVDDEWNNRVVFEQAFAKSFTLRSVASGEEALAVLESETVAVLVADQRMPGMSGNELLQQAMKRWPDVVRIVLTAYAELEPILRAVNEGLVARYVVKPWDRVEMEEMLGWAVETWSRGRQDSAVQMRLLETERLATLGSLAAALFHDVDNILGHVRTDLSRLEDLAKSAPALEALAG
ncbi:MAG: response regulator, partial [Stellaceae bacterium]